MSYIKPQDRGVIDQFAAHLAAACGGVDDNLNYAISRLVAASYAPEGKWEYSQIQRAAGLFHCIAHEFDRRVADVCADEAMSRNGDIKEYVEFEIEDQHRGLVRFVVNQFSVSGTMKRSAFDTMIRDSVASWESDEHMFAFTNRLHKDGYIVMHPETVTLGLDGLELRKCLQRT